MTRVTRSNSPRARKNAKLADRRRAALGSGLERLEVRNLLVSSVLINEVYFNSPGETDTENQYIELRGTPNLSLDNHYFIVVEGEDNGAHTGETGMIDRVFDLSGQTIGSNGFLLLRTKGNPYTTIAPGTTNLVNTGSGAGWGSFSEGTSTLKVEAQDDPDLLTPKPKMEGSGGTFMVIKNNGDPVDNAPEVDDDLDTGNDGLDVPTGRASWEILDAIGIHGESGEATNGRLYGKINFGVGASSRIPAGATYVNVTFEIEYIGRYGNSTGETATDWDVANLTDRNSAGFTGNDFRQSGNPHPPTPAGPYAPNFVLESSHGVPYGTNRTGSLGAPNFPGLPPVSTIVNRQLFYNQSSFDGNNISVNTTGAANDDTAIATDKTAYVPGAGAMSMAGASFPNTPQSFRHVSSFTRGINGLMIDITGLHAGVTASDFVFKVGNNNTPSLWANAPDPTSVTVRTSGVGLASGDTRVEIIWPNASIRNTWLEVQVKANTNTGLDDAAQSPNGDGIGSTFFFGSRVGDSGSGDTAAFLTTATDEIGSRNNAASGQPLTNRFDYNKDGLVTATDQITSRNNAGSINFLNITDPPAAPTAIPAALPDVNGVASALAGAVAKSASNPVAIIKSTPPTSSLVTGLLDKWLENLTEIDKHNAIKPLQLRVVANVWAHFDADLLDSLLVELGLS